MRSYSKMGAALQEIQDSELFRSTHPTWKAYVSEVWTLSPRRAAQLINASIVASEMLSLTGADIKSESATAAFEKVAHDKRREVYEASRAIADKRGHADITKHDVQSAIGGRDIDAASTEKPPTLIKKRNKRTGVARWEEMFRKKIVQEGAKMIKKRREELDLSARHMQVQDVKQKLDECFEAFSEMNRLE